MKNRGIKRELIGTVVSDKMDKTITVALSQRKTHPMYGKTVKVTKKIKAHDENNTSGVGDTVKVMETRPISKSKRWRLVEVVEKAK